MVTVPRTIIPNGLILFVVVVLLRQDDFVGADSDTGCALLLRRSNNSTGAVCITYNDIDSALDFTKQTDVIANQSGKFDDFERDSLEMSTGMLDTLGRLNWRTTRAIAEQFQLTRDEIINALPSVDMSKSSFWPLCPLLVRDQDIKCEPSRYRSFTGHCNNLEHPTWGAAMTDFKRHLAPAYQDAIRVPRKSVAKKSSPDPDLRGAADNEELPSAFSVSFQVHSNGDQQLTNNVFSMLFVSYGQLMAHELASMIQVSSDSCPGHPNCRHWQLPTDDPSVSRYKIPANFFRDSNAAIGPNCALGPRVDQNIVTSMIDASLVYGSDTSAANSLRQFEGGKMKTYDSLENDALKPLLPVDEDCAGDKRDIFECFLAGDFRVNHQVQLTALHTLHMREHNRLADKLAEINPHWSDEQLYQETRRIVAAGVQHVLISEYLPLLIGDEMTRFYNLSAHDGSLKSSSDPYWNGHDPSVSTSISAEFASAALRVGHSLVPGHFDLYDKDHEYVASRDLRGQEALTFAMYEAGMLDKFISGMINQPCLTFDQFASEFMLAHVFQDNNEFGTFLPATNMERGRGQGLHGYNSYREWCGLGRVESFEQLAPLMANNTAHIYSTLYRHVDDIDLWSAGVSERKLSGTPVGPTFACILGRQFRDSRRGDRFWYENPNFPSSFSPGQLAELRKITLAKILCRNSDDLPTIQRWPMLLAHPVTNPRLRCEDLPEIDLDPWRDS